MIDETFVGTVGEPISITPVAGSLLVPERAVEHLREAGDASIKGSGWVPFSIAPEGGATVEIVMGYERTAVPDEGPLILELSSLSTARYTPAEEGIHSITALNFNLLPDEQSTEVGGLGIDCHPTGDGDRTIDTFDVHAAPAPTPSNSAPVRPVLVQTDFAADEAASSGWMVAPISAALAIAAYFMRRRGSQVSRSRTHESLSDDGR